MAKAWVHCKIYLPLLSIQGMQALLSDYQSNFRLPYRLSCDAKGEQRLRVPRIFNPKCPQFSFFASHSHSPSLTFTSFFNVIIIIIFLSCLLVAFGICMPVRRARPSARPYINFTEPLKNILARCDFDVNCEASRPDLKRG